MPTGAGGWLGGACAGTYDLGAGAGGGAGRLKTQVHSISLHCYSLKRVVQWQQAGYQSRGREFKTGKHPRNF